MFCFVPVALVLVILLCISMTAWYIVRGNNRLANGLYCVFARLMIISFQTIMFSMSELADMLHLNNPSGMV
jgi:raffinose/stachyose/melibiose transport system permease protein